MQRQCAALAQQRPADHLSATIGRRVAGGHDENGAPAIFLERIEFKVVSDESAIGELADTAGGIAGNTLPQLAIMIVAGVGVAREPFLDGERIAAGVVKREQAVGAAHRERPAIGR